MIIFPDISVVLLSIDNAEESEKLENSNIVRIMVEMIFCIIFINPQIILTILIYEANYINIFCINIITI